jgi:acetolactate synthase-1/2/3 large subunit
MTLAIQQPKPHSEAAARPLPVERSGAQIICEVLREQHVTVLFGYPGGAIMPFYDALPQYGDLRHILVRHEQAAALAADGWARITGRPGVCVATSGPGATNLVTGLANAYMDSVPMVAITGQVNLSVLGKDAFQETDVLGLTQPVTKHNFLIERVEDIAPVLREAFALARGGRPGPGRVDNPKDVQFHKALYAAPDARVTPLRPHAHPRPAARPQHYHRAAELLNQARRPLLMAGHGIILADACNELRALAERAGLPVITTLLGISAFPEDHPLYLGMPGMHGPAHVNRAIAECDVLLGVGLRFDDRVVGKVSEFAPHAKIIHFDIDPSEIGKVVPTEVGVVADARRALRLLRRLVTPNDHSAWLREIQAQRVPEAAVPDGHPEPSGQGAAGPESLGAPAEPASPAEPAAFHPTPAAIFKAIKTICPAPPIVVTDVGQNQMWAARHFGFVRPNSHITSGGLGAMGYALPAAMGIKLARPHDTVWVIAGDGGIQMNLQELATLAHYGIDLKIAILNNGYLGMVRQWQQFFHGGNYSETPISGPDYRMLAAAYGLHGRRVEHRDDVLDATRQAMSTPGTFILDFVIESQSNVFPMVRPGGAITNMILS